MFPKLDPKKMSAVMKQFGIKQEEIDARRVIIEKTEGRIVIENPQITKVNMSGNESFQISGDISEESAEEETSEEEIEKDIQTIMDKTQCSREEASLALEKNNGDIAAAILELSE